MTSELTCDVLVIGAGVSGCYAAIQAARCGCQTILLEKDTVVGGNSGSNVWDKVRGVRQVHRLYRGLNALLQYWNILKGELIVISSTGKLK